ncbi:MAG: hypothetical protein EP344_17670 [Bacteroidetes bacterium]|nr:MAG: hypothetical protein EP344_17670 [Bacteroidota bacterium]
MTPKPIYFTSLFCLCFLFFRNSCSYAPPAEAIPNQGSSMDSLAEVRTPPPAVCGDVFDRDSILLRLQDKINLGEILTVHTFVPLCDNEHQGIVPVNAQLGDGQNLRTNLYWGAGYGVRTFFQRDRTWKQLQMVADPSSSVLERVIFEKTFPNGARVLLVADAYRGDRMQECLHDYLSALAGLRPDTLALADSGFVIQRPDLAIFNGHNGLMDMETEQIIQTGTGQIDAAVIACISNRYFNEPLRCAGAYPVVTTRQLMAPEAYVLHAIIENWALLNSAAQIRKQAANAYARYQKCSYRGASAIFSTGWE